MRVQWEDAVKSGDPTTVSELLAEGVDIDARDRYGQTGLMLAAHAGHADVVELLIEHGADLNVTAKFGLSALMLAIVAGHTETAQRIAHAGCDLSIRGSGSPGFTGKTAGDLATERGMHDLAKRLHAV